MTGVKPQPLQVAGKTIYFSERMDRDSKAPPTQRRSNLFAATPFVPPKQAGENAARSIPPASLITAEDLSVVFQPIVRLDPLRIFAYEALVRCRLPEFRNPTVLFDARGHLQAARGRSGA